MGEKLKVLQVTNIISHHQLPLAREIVNIIGEENFKFCATGKVDSDRLKIGWNSDCSDSWVLRPSEKYEDKLTFDKWWDECDVLLCGERLFSKMHNRLNEKKLCFYMSERWWKPPLGKLRLLSPTFFKMAMEFKLASKSPYFHYLSIGPYAFEDISFISSGGVNNWKWGYFTEGKSIDFKRADDGVLRILWAGRMLKWKNVDSLIIAASEIESKDISFHLSIVGDGPEKKHLQELASNTLCKKNYSFFDAMPVDSVQKLMNKSDVYVLPSSAYEGWGAVINEAMGCGCVVIASNKTGAAASIIKDGCNGFLIAPGNWRQIADRLAVIAENKELCERVGLVAMDSILNIWSPKIAASRFLSFCEHSLAGKSSVAYQSGPMSSVFV